jgi:hypothetical protein
MTQHHERTSSDILFAGASRLCEIPGLETCEAHASQKGIDYGKKEACMGNRPVLAFTSD